MHSFAGRKHGDQGRAQVGGGEVIGLVEHGLGEPITGSSGDVALAEGHTGGYPGCSLAPPTSRERARGSHRAAPTRVRGGGRPTPRNEQCGSFSDEWRQNVSIRTESHCG